jgi:hypothetical protein
MSEFVLNSSGATITLTNVSASTTFAVENGFISPTLINPNLNETGETPAFSIQIPSFVSYKYNTIQPGDSITFESTNKDEILYYYNISKNPFAGIAVTVTPNGGGGSAVLIEKTITENGIYNAVDDEADGYSSVTVDVVSDMNAKFIYRDTLYDTFTITDALDTITIPEGYTTIASGTFNDFKLSEIIIPSTMTHFEVDPYVFETADIGTMIFADGFSQKLDYSMIASSSIHQIVIPDTITGINENTFENISIDIIEFKSLTPVVADINAFYGLDTDCTIYVPQGSLQAYTTAENYPDPTIYTYVEY